MRFHQHQHVLICSRHASCKAADHATLCGVLTVWARDGDMSLGVCVWANKQVRVTCSLLRKVLVIQIQAESRCRALSAG